MTAGKTPKSTNFVLSENDVADFLREHPDFFARNEDLLHQLRLPHAERGAVSLVELQLSKLRARVADLEEEITQLMSIASGNEILFRAFASAHRALFAATHLADIELALDKLAHRLNLTVSLRLYDDGDVRLSRAKVDAAKASHFCGKPRYLGRLQKKVGLHFVTNAPELGSYALLPVGEGKEYGFLSFASQDGGHFQPHMDTLFVEQIASHIAVLLQHWQE